MANLDLIVGVQKAGDGGRVVGRAGHTGEVIVSQLHGRYYEQARRGNLFTSYVATVATSVPATATIGNMVWNPPGSGVYLSMLKWTSQIVATSAACTGIVLAGGYQTTTPTTVTAATFTGRTLINKTTQVEGAAKAYSVATVITIPLVVVVLHHNTAAIATTGEDVIAGDLEGSIVVDEGGFVTMAALGGAAAASAHTSSLMWEEIPKP